MSGHRVFWPIVIHICKCYAHCLFAAPIPCNHDTSVLTIDTSDTNEYICSRFNIKPKWVMPWLKRSFLSISGVVTMRLVAWLYHLLGFSWICGCCRGWNQYRAFQEEVTEAQLFVFLITNKRSIKCKKSNKYTIMQTHSCLFTRRRRSQNGGLRFLQF